MLIQIRTHIRTHAHSTLLRPAQQPVHHQHHHTQTHTEALCRYQADVDALHTSRYWPNIDAEIHRGNYGASHTLIEI